MGRAGAQSHSVCVKLFDSQSSDLLLQQKVPRQPPFTHMPRPSHPKVLPSTHSDALCCSSRETEHCGGGGGGGGGGEGGGGIEGGEGGEEGEGKEGGVKGG